ncbi:MAG: EAL domain-containing protein [Desulfobacterales bacterium]|nr:EAL domain-containing protein [Desulfobacterales bacterium]
MTTQSAKKERILIVDDTPANIDVLGAILMQDYEISVAVNGPMALDIMESGLLPDLVLLDIMMPEMDGYEVARQLKSNEKTREIPVIFVTAKIEEEDEAFGFQMGAVDYIRKPVNSDVTLARIKSQLELKRYRDHLTDEIREKSHQVRTSAHALETERHKLDKTTRDLAGVQASALKNQVYFKELFMNSPHGIILVGPDNKIINTNKSFSDLVGYETDEIINKKTSGFSVADDLKDAHESLIQEALVHGSMSMETRCFHKQGYEIHVSALAYPVKINNRVQGVFVFYENISQRKQFENKLRHQAFHDALTGIPNRLLFSEQLDIAIQKQETLKDYRFAVLLIDLDRFKSVNDSLGHQAGDTLLKAITKRVQNHLRDGDTLARMGGDEFAVILSKVGDSARVEAIASRIREAAESKFTIDGNEVHISASIGIVLDTRSYTRADQLLRDADLAMYQAKDAGKARFKFFTPEMRKDLLRRMNVEKELRHALENEELSLFFQPIVRVADSRVNGVEALVRWQHPEKGLIPPDRFIPIAEETGLILPVGDWIISEACRTLRQLQSGYGDHLTMSINISIKQFLQNNFVADLINTVQAREIHPSTIKLEFTESLLMTHTDSAVEKLNTLKGHGFILVIDDFGTGYSSLSYLQQFPIDEIKIDRSFILSMETRRESKAIVTSILSLSKGLGLTTVAEGVETGGQLDSLAGLHCEFAQGYYFSKPCPVSDLTTKSTLDFSRS